MDNVRIFKEKNGVEYIFSRMEGLNTCTISIMINTGSIYETSSLRGGAHLIEHLIFKGNTQYETQLELSKKLESYGAHYNAYTDTNIVSFHVKVQKKYAKQVIDILGNMVLNSYLRDKDITDEKKVVVQELEKDYDVPSIYIHELIMELVYKGNNYGKSVGGTKKSVLGINNANLRNFWKTNYNLHNIAISIAGDFPLTDIQDYIKTSPFMNSNIEKGKTNTYTKLPNRQIGSQYKYEIRENMSQIQLAIAFPTCGNQHPDKFVLDIIKLILAGPMSSRLFTTLRTKYGLAYNVSCSVNLNKLSGDITISTGVDGSEIFTDSLNTNTSKKADPLKVILDEIFKLCLEPITQDELNLTKEFIDGTTILESDDSEAISQVYGKQRIIHGEIMTIEKYLEKIKKVTIKDVSRVAKKVFKPHKINIALIGKFSKQKCESYMGNVESKYKNYLRSQ